MPETEGTPRRGRKLSEAEEIGQLVHVHCQLCRVQHHYRPADLLQLAGDVIVRNLNGRMRCTRCRSSDHLAVRLVLPTAREMQTIRVRRLAGIKMVRQVIWKDD